MDPTLRAFIRANYAASPAASIPVKEVISGFRASLSEEEAAAWPRSRCIAELAAAGYVVGLVGKVQHVAGLAPRHAELRAIGGQLERVHA